MSIIGVGAAVGVEVGAIVGDAVGNKQGLIVGFPVDAKVGVIVGFLVLTEVCVFEGGSKLLFIAFILTLHMNFFTLNSFFLSWSGICNKNQQICYEMLRSIKS